jgi:tetrahydromethanopterin S-methyltransferase subunit B
VEPAGAVVKINDDGGVALLKERIRELEHTLDDALAALDVSATMARRALVRRRIERALERRRTLRAA